MNDTSKLKGPWYRFSLRTIFVIVALASIPFAWLGHMVREKQLEREAVTAIRQLGGEPSYDYEFAFHADVGDPTPPGPAWIRKLLGEDFFARVTYLDLTDPRLSDDTMTYLQQLPHLERFHLRNATITDAGLTNLKKLDKLKTVTFFKTRITDKGLENLRHLKHLQILDLSGTSVTDAGLTNLQELAELRDLNLANLPISDAGLVHLRDLISLEILHLDGTHVTEQGWLEFMILRPDAFITRAL